MQPIEPEADGEFTPGEEGEEDTCELPARITYLLQPDGALPVLEFQQFEAGSVACPILTYELFETNEDPDNTTREYH